MQVVVAPRRVTDLSLVERRARGLGLRFWSFWAAAAVSSLGDGLALVAFPLVAASVTHDPRLIAGVAVAQRLPWLLFSLPAGALADRVAHRRLLGAVETSRMAVLVLLAGAVFLGRSELLAIYACAFALGALETGFSGASFAALPTLVAGAELPRANGYLFAAQTAGEQFVGPAIGGIIFAAAASAPFLLDGVSFAASALLLAAALPRVLAPTRTEHRGIRADTGEGLRWFWSSPTARRLAAVVSGFAFCQAAVLGVLVLFCVQTLHLGAAGYGVFLAVGASGNVLGGVFAGRVHDRFGTRPVLVASGVAAAAAYLCIGAAPNAAIAAAAFVVEAAAVALGNVASVSLRQQIIPDELRGRVGNVFRMCIFGVMPLGALGGGLVAAGAGLRVAIVLAGAVQAIIVAAFAASRAGLAIDTCF